MNTYTHVPPTVAHVRERSAIVSLFSFLLASALSISTFSAHASAQVAVNLDRVPDAVISTKNLSQLPRDILAVPVLRDLLTEDFVFYYRDGGADWMSFRGVLARIAFEHKTEWPVQFMAWLLNSPAEVALWKSGDGKLSHFMLVLDQSGMKALFENVAKIAASDSQLQRHMIAGRPGYKITLPLGREIFMSSEEGRLFISTSDKVTLPESAKNRSFADRAKSFFGANSDIAVFAPKLGNAKHAVVASASYLSFGYQAFFSGIRALRFEFDSKTKWRTEVLTDGSVAMIDEKDWTQMPQGAAFCFGVPVNKTKVGAIAKAPAWLEKASGTAVACWYAESKFYTPVIAVRGDFAGSMERSAELKAAFESMIGSREAYWKKSPEGEESPVSHADLQYLAKLPVVETKTANRVLWSREVGGRYGLHAKSKSKNGAKITSHRFFRVKLAATSTSLVFSPDDALVDRALTTIDGKFPSMAATLPAGGKKASVIFGPGPFSKLAKASIGESLQGETEGEFRSAISRHLVPNLEKLGKSPLQAATVTGANSSVASGGSLAWKNMEWSTSAKR